MKKEKRVMTLVIVALVLAGIFGLSLVTYLRDGKQVYLKGDVSGASNSATSTYKDWSELTDIDNSYSYSTLVFTKDTEFFVNGSEGANIYYIGNSNTGALPYIELLNTGDHAQIIITNCGVDQEGNVLSATLDVTAKDVWDHHVEPSTQVARGGVWFNVAASTNMPKGSQSIPNTERQQSVITSNTEGSPIRFGLSTQVAQADVKLTYYKNLSLSNVQEGKYTTPSPYSSSVESGLSLTGASVNTSGSAIATSIDKVNTYYYDIDIPRSYFRYDDQDQKTTQYTDKIFEGREGMAPTKGNSTIYYTKNGHNASGSSTAPGAATFDNGVTNNTCTDPANCTFDGNDMTASVPNYTSVTIAEGDNGIFCKKNDLWAYGISHTDDKRNIDGVWYGQSAEFLTENVAGEFEFTYAGSDNGSSFIFFTPNGYDVDDPIKKVSKTQVEPDEVFYFSVMQYIPNNYATNVVNLHDVYSNMSVNNYVSSFSFEDTIDDRLTIVPEQIRVTDINGNDLAAYFTVNISGQTVTTTQTAAATEFFQTVGAYNTYYILQIPVKYVGTVTSDITIPNKGKTTLKIGERSSRTSETNEVTVKIVPKVIKLTYDCMTNGGKEANYTINMKAGDSVDLSRLCTKDGNKFVGWAENATNTTNMKSFTMPDHDTTIYGLYRPITCDLLLKSNVYNVDEKNKTISIPMEDSNEEILKNVFSNGDISLGDGVIIVKCEENEQPYKIIRYWKPNTGRPLIKWTLIISGLALLTIIGIIVKVLMNKKAN